MTPAASRSGAPPQRLALGLMVASGAAGLGYQIVWTQQCALWLGHEAAAVLAVVAAFFGGLAAGALTLGARIARSAHPARWYAACEAVIGLWALALAGLMAPASSGLLALIGAQPAPAWQWGVAFAGTFVLLLPATAAMGATLPAMAQVLARLQRQGTAIGALYAGNTAGAVLGVLAACFWAVPGIGLARTAMVCAALNGLCAIAALALRPADGAAAPAPAPATPDAARPVAARAVLGTLAATGLLGIGYEVLVVRVLSQVTENTVYTFALLLAVYLVGTALGAAAWQRWLAASPVAARWRDRLLAGLALAAGLGTAGLWGAEALKRAVLAGLGAGLPGALAAEALLALAAFLPATLVMGALFSHLAEQARAAGIGFGRALGVNTLGAAAAPGLFGVLLAPALGPKLALLAVAGGYLALCSRPAWRSAGVLATAGLLAGLAAWAPPLAFVDLPAGGRVVSYADGALAAVSVVEDAQGVSRLRINNRQQEGSSTSRPADARQALLPLLLHPAPRQALFLGLGTGVTARAAADDPRLQVDAVELLPEVIAAAAHFAGDAPDNPRLHLLAGDARRHVRSTDRRYDVIVSDNFHPARSGSALLYTVEHFRAVGGRLTPGGLFCQWLPLHQLDLASLRSIVGAFLQAHPAGLAMLATNSLDTPVLGLVARGDGARIDVGAVRRRIAETRGPLGLDALGLGDEWAVLGSVVAGPRSLAAFAAGAPVNTDDQPVVAYRAPRITYAPDSLPRDRLAALLRRFTPSPDEIITGLPDAAWAPRLAAYWAARDRFIDAGRQVRPSADVHAMLAQVGAPLLAVLGTSPDFRPAYDPLLRMAVALADDDEAGARALLAALARLQPARPEAVLALRALAGTPR